jgi:hypothetical protein
MSALTTYTYYPTTDAISKGHTSRVSIKHDLGAMLSSGGNPNGAPSVYVLTKGSVTQLNLVAHLRELADRIEANDPPHP